MNIFIIYKCLYAGHESRTVQLDGAHKILNMIYYFSPRWSPLATSSWHAARHPDLTRAHHSAWHGYRPRKIRAHFWKQKYYCHNQSQNTHMRFVYATVLCRRCFCIKDFKSQLQYYAHINLSLLITEEKLTHKKTCNPIIWIQLLYQVSIYNNQYLVFNLRKYLIDVMPI